MDEVLFLLGEFFDAKRNRNSAVRLVFKKAKFLPTNYVAEFLLTSLRANKFASWKTGRQAKTLPDFIFCYIRMSRA